MKATVRPALAALTLSLALGCGETPETAKPASSTNASAPAAIPPPAPEPTGEDLIAQGKQAYLSNCIACHNTNPAKEGALGPPVTGSSEALIRARVIDGVYPEGYKPKRDTQAMVPMPFLAKQVPALTAYLSAAK